MEAMGRVIHLGSTGAGEKASLGLLTLPAMDESCTAPPLCLLPASLPCETFQRCVGIFSLTAGASGLQLKSLVVFVPFPHGQAIAIQSQYWDCLRVKVTALQSTLNIGGAVHHALHPGTLPGLMRPNRASFGMSQGTEEGTDDGEDSEDSGELLPDAEDESESSDAAPHSQVETHDRLRQDRSGFEEELGPEELAHEASRDLEIEDEESSSHETGGVEIKGAASDVAITPRIDGNGGLPVSQEERPMGPHVTAGRQTVTWLLLSFVSMSDVFLSPCGAVHQLSTGTPSSLHQP